MRSGGRIVQDRTTGRVYPQFGQARRGAGETWRHRQRNRPNATSVAWRRPWATPRAAASSSPSAPRGASMGKDDVAAAVGIERRLAGFHLDKLVEQGFLRGRASAATRAAGGPGAGRPPKRYRLAESRGAHGAARAPLRAAGGPAAARDRRGRLRRRPQEVLERVGYDFGYEVGRAEAAAGGSGPGRHGVGGDPGRRAPALPLRLRGARRRARTACAPARAPSRRSPSTTPSASAASTGRSGAGCWPPSPPTPRCAWPPRGPRRRGLRGDVEALTAAACSSRPSRGSSRTGRS